MQKAEAQYKQAQNLPTQLGRKGASLESPQGERIAQLEMMMENSPRMATQHKAISAIHNSPNMTTQRQQLDRLTGKTAQCKRVKEPLQLKVTQREEAPVRPNNTGLPDNLKSGIESQSGLSMDKVKVHYNSSHPAQFNTLAYAQGRVKPTMQMKMGFELQVMNEIFNDKRTEKPAEGKEVIATDGTVGIERDGKNPEFVSAAYDEKTVEPAFVGEEVSKVITNYGNYLKLFPEKNSNLVHVSKDSEEERIVDVQATGGFDLSEVEGWYRTIIEQTNLKNKTKQSNRFDEERIIPFQARDIRFDSVHKKGGRRKRTEANYSRIVDSLKTIPEVANRPKVRGLMALINTNIMAIVGAVSGDKDAPGIKALTAILPKSNLSTLYKHSFDEDDKKNFDEVNQSIMLNESHPWHKPIDYGETVEGKSRLGWEYVRRWKFFPVLYMNDIKNGVEPMWVFEGFSEVHDNPYERDSVYEEVIETHGIETAMKLAGDRLPAREKWYPRIGGNFAEAIIEMRELGYGDLPLPKIAVWAQKAFEVYATYRNSTK